MNSPDAAPLQPDTFPPTAVDDDDDVQGHRMLTPEQAQQRSDAARMEKEQRLAEESGGRSATS